MIDDTDPFAAPAAPETTIVPPEPAPESDVAAPDLATVDEPQADYVATSTAFADALQAGLVPPAIGPDPIVIEGGSAPPNADQIAAANAAYEAIMEPAPEEQPAPESVFINGDTPIAMTHPDNGSCDAYPRDVTGRILVPAIDVPEMLSHGFVVASVQ